ncbi:MAG: hypothetical protein AAGD25_15120 [Cyanobacteria bacterium P01_F01_bin.150]
MHYELAQSALTTVLYIVSIVGSFVIAFQFVAGFMAYRRDRHTATPAPVVVPTAEEIDVEELDDWDQRFTAFQLDTIADPWTTPDSSIPSGDDINRDCDRLLANVISLFPHRLALPAALVSYWTLEELKAEFKTLRRFNSSNETKFRYWKDALVFMNNAA